MIKYLVLWTILTMIQVPCHHKEVGPDEFGRIDPSSAYTTTLEICYETQKKHMQKLFNTKAEAELFMDRGRTDPRYFPFVELVDWRIKEVSDFDLEAFEKDLDATLKKGHPR